MAFFVHHTLQPFSYAIYLELLAANLPMCFIELRLLLETLVKCYLADLKHPSLSSSQEKLASLDRNISKLMDEMGEEIGVGDGFRVMWNSLSENWVHTKGLANNVLGFVIEKATVPPWALGVPMHYTKSDLEAIAELRQQIATFRNLLKRSIKAYR